MNRTVVFFAETKVGHGHVTVCAGEFIWRFSFLKYVCSMFSVAFMSIHQPLQPLGHFGCTCTKNETWIGNSNTNDVTIRVAHVGVSLAPSLVPRLFI